MAEKEARKRRRGELQDRFKVKGYFKSMRYGSKHCFFS